MIAYQIIGDRPLDLVFLTGRISNVDMRWEDPASARFLEGLASFSRVITFDRRGVGASDRLPASRVPTWEEWAEDLKVVLDAAQSHSAAVFSVSDGGQMAISFAASHPERVRSLVLFNLVGIVPVQDDDAARESADAVASFEEQFWGTEEFVPLVCPSVTHDPVQTAWWAKYMRATATPRAIAMQNRVASRTDVRFVLPTLRVPTLVMQRSERTPQGVESAFALAQSIPGARLVEVPGRDAPPQTEHSRTILNLVEEFVTGATASHAPDRFLATVLFTDIVDSTQTAGALGDGPWRELLDDHDQVVRAELKRFQGREIATTGDGFLATFDAPARAIQCGLAISAGARRLGIEVRIGLHTGEVEARGTDIGGISVHTGARVAAMAGPGEVLVSRTVTDLVAGSGIDFEDRGEHELKGVPGTWRLFTVRA